MGFPGGSGVKNPPASAGDARDVGSIPGSGRSPGGKMATHSSILAWKFPWAEEPGGLHCTGVTRSRTRLSTCTHTHTHTEYSTGNYIQQSLINLNEIEKKCLSWERERVFDVWTLSPHGPE